LCNSLIACEVQDSRVVDAVIRMIKANLKPFEDMSYLRGLGYTEFKEVINYSFENILINSELMEVIIEHTNLDEKNIDFIIRFLNTINNYIIVKRYTRNRFEKTVYDMFRFDEAKVNFLWELFDNRRQELINIALLNNITLCRGIREDLINLLDIFGDIFEEQEDN